MKAVNVLASTITITTDAGADMQLKVVSNTQIKIGVTLSTFVSLATKIGSMVDVTYDAQTMTATSINAQG